MARPRVSPTEKTCIVCGTIFPIPDPNKIKRKTCSEKCLKENLTQRRKGKKFPGIGGSPRKTPDTASCIICKKEFYLTVSQSITGKKTCSYECKCKYYSQISGGLGTTTCESCGKEYAISRYFIRHKRRFCGDECRLQWFSKQTPTGEDNPYWKGGSVEYYGPSWRKARKDVWERDKETCQKCGRTSKELGYRPIVHHLKPFKSFGLENHLIANQLDNLTCVCRSCHMKEEWQEHKITKYRSLAKKSDFAKTSS